MRRCLFQELSVWWKSRSSAVSQRQLGNSPRGGETAVGRWERLPEVGMATHPEGGPEGCQVEGKGHSTATNFARAWYAMTRGSEGGEGQDGREGGNRTGAR